MYNDENNLDGTSNRSEENDNVNAVNETASDSSTSKVEDIYVESIQRDVLQEEQPEQQENVQQTDATAGESVKKKQKFGKIFAKVIAAAAVFGLVAGGVFVGVDSIRNRAQETEISEEETSIDATQTSTTKKNYSGVSEIVENVMPSIVAITSTTQAVSYDFFGRPSVSEASGAGSGIIVGQVDDELLIATNNHVIDGATSIVIQFIDDTTATGEVKGAEASSDLAVVSVNMNNLSEDTMNQIKIATLGNSDDCQEGELVIAIGNALGYGQSTTVGYISAKNREVTVEDVTLNLLQTDAAINPGNSGGALLNAKGEVIGINSVKYVLTEVEGIGYAIPISSAVPIINDLMNRTELSNNEKGYLGIGGNDVTETEAEMLNIPVGIYINKVESGSPADEAGIKVRDIITGVNGRTIETLEELQNYLNYTKAGTTVTFTISVNENGTYVEKSIDVTLGKRK